jgi:hypothetical protein
MICDEYRGKNTGRQSVKTDKKHNPVKSMYVTSFIAYMQVPGLNCKFHNSFITRFYTNKHLKLSHV